MKYRSVLLFLFVLLLVAWSCTVVFAQEATLEPDIEQPPPVDLETVPAGDVTIEADDPFGPEEALTALGWLAGSIAMAMEFIKTAFLQPLLPRDPITNEPVTSRRYVIGVQVIAFGLSLGTILALGDPRYNILAALGIFASAPIWLAQILSALTVSFGNLFLHSLNDFFAKARGRPVVRAR